MSHRHRTGEVPWPVGRCLLPSAYTLRKERWWAKSFKPFPGFRSRDGGNISTRSQAREEAYDCRAVGRLARGGLGRRTMRDLQRSRGRRDAGSASLAWLWAIGRHREGAQRKAFRQLASARCALATLQVSAETQNGGRFQGSKQAQHCRILLATS